MAAGNNPHTINWFELPTKDIGRAQKFYETVLEQKLEPQEMGECKLAIFPGKGDIAEGQALVHGALIQMTGAEPSDKGALVYFNTGEDLEPYLARVEGAGGSIVKGKTSIGPHGFFAMFKDTEGNVAALHSSN